MPFPQTHCRMPQVGLSAQIRLVVHRCLIVRQGASFSRSCLPSNTRASLHLITATIPHAGHKAIILSLNPLFVIIFGPVLFIPDFISVIKSIFIVRQISIFVEFKKRKNVSKYNQMFLSHPESLCARDTQTDTTSGIQHNNRLFSIQFFLIHSKKSLVPRLRETLQTHY